MENVLLRVLPLLPSSRWVRYGWTAFIVGIFVLLRFALQGPLHDWPLIMFFFPVFLAALLFDRGSGYFATFLSVLIADLLWIEPVGSLRIDAMADLIRLAMFVALCLTVAALVEALRKALERTAKGEREKATLLRELNHRVLNDLQGVSSILRTGYRKDEHSREILLRAADRVDAVGRVYGRLQLQSLQGAECPIDLREYLEELAHDLRLSLSQMKPVTLAVFAEPVRVTLQCATTVGMIVNELVTNSIKYGYYDGQFGQVTVRALKRGEALVVTVVDDGNGMPPQSERGKGLGTALVRQLARQHDGNVEYESAESSGRGVRVTVRLYKTSLLGEPETQRLSDGMEDAQ